MAGPAKMYLKLVDNLCRRQHGLEKHWQLDQVGLSAW